VPNAGASYQVGAFTALDCGYSGTLVYRF
jgi:hypothetical protein